MVSTNLDGSIVKGPYQDVKKDKPSTASRPQQYQQRSQMTKEKNNSWGPVYKNKQHFIDMHIC